ncbi:hypothetical protein IWQ62_002409 [Dispira parvispora]|uniref:Endonuclease/exonuclease/phosphatase domain-containing protein n=1 Tax=Dispira parvispora TaxID=1520584 RepID=A0A9W8E810_9FUNG|nr:hypothetical protein IWQ62_002409 [Dispira parvispora]
MDNVSSTSNSIPACPTIVPGIPIQVDARPVTAEPPTSINKPLRVLQWNIERGYQLDAVLKVLAQVDPDIAILQELDIHCVRSGETDQFNIIARTLGWNGGFVAEFEELHSPLRDSLTQGGGFHGNAIFSKFDMDLRAIVHQYQPVNWEKEGITFREPRRGGRVTLAATIRPPGQPPVLAYSAHLEVFCGLSHRVWQLAEILDDAYQQLPLFPHQLLFGDLNTMAHSWARLVPKYCRDQFRWRSFGRNEATWLTKYVLEFYRTEVDMVISQDKTVITQEEPKGTLPGKLVINRRLAVYGSKVFPERILQMALNPGFTDPWDTKRDITLTNFYGLYKGKLDWTLTMGFRCLSKLMGNHDYKASDHKYLVLELDYVEK